EAIVKSVTALPYRPGDLETENAPLEARCGLPYEARVGRTTMRGRMTGRSGLVCLALLALAVATPRVHAGTGGRSGSAATVDPLDANAEAPTPEVWDPLERLNRKTFRMNGFLDRWVFDPVTNAYAFVVPSPARLAVRRFLVNLNSPVVFANDLLQLAPVDAGVTLTRFVVNSSIGIGGLFDPATKLG